jgi:hypothetical protein
MVETYKGADAGEVKGLRVVGGAGCLGCHGYGMGHLIQGHNRDVLPGGAGSLDTMARERLECQHGSRWPHRDRSQRWQERWRWKRTSEGELSQPGAVKVLPTFEGEMTIGMEDCDRCLVKDNLAALVGKKSQTNEGMGERWHDMA